MNFGWILKPLYASILRYQNLNSSAKEGDKTNLQSQYDHDWRVEWICLGNNLEIEPTARYNEFKNPAILAKSLKIAVPENIITSKVTFNFDNFLSGIRNCIRIVSIIKPSHWLTCIGSKHDFSEFIFRPDNSKSFWWIILAAAADTLSGWPEIPSSKYTKQLWLVERQRFTSGRNNFVKQKHAELNPNGKTLKVNNEFFYQKAKRILNTTDDRHKCPRDGTRLQIPRKEPKIMLEYFWKTP